jgi:hypothetical protein
MHGSGTQLPSQADSGPRTTVRYTFLMLKNLFRSSEAIKKELQLAAEKADALGDLDMAITARRQLVKLEPGPRPHLALAETLRKAGEMFGAVQAYEEALKHGASPVDTHLQLGALHLELENHPLAKQHLEKVTVAEPGHLDALCMLGVVMNDQGRYSDAVAYFERALEGNPAFSEAHFNLGLARFELQDFAGAMQSIARCAELRRGPRWQGSQLAPPQSDPSPAFEPMEMGVNAVKLRHDCEQLTYLMQLGRLGQGYGVVLDDYQSLLQEIRGTVDDASFIPFDHRRHPLVARTYKRPIYIQVEAPPVGPLLNPELDFSAVEDSYLEARPQVVVVDDLLSAPALQALRRFCRESTIWNSIKPGYLGAFFFDGFCSEVLLGIAWELRERMPRVIRDLPLQTMWGFKCDSTLPGLGVHADAAAVNVNFWITEDEANLAPERGGLLVYEHDAPKDWGFRKFNSGPAAILDHLDSVGSVPQCFPYRANRAVIFDSDLFHATDNPHFREGYVSRRINITFLYGGRQA